MNVNYCLIDLSDESVAVVSEHFRVVIMTARPEGGTSYTEYFQRSLDASNADCMGNVMEYLYNGDNEYDEWQNEDYKSKDRINDALEWMHPNCKYTQVDSFADQFFATSMAIKKYVEDNGNHCFKCGSHDVESGAMYFSHAIVQDKECRSCQSKWQDNYSLTGVSDGEVV